LSRKEELISVKIYISLNFFGGEINLSNFKRLCTNY